MRTRREGTLRLLQLLPLGPTVVGVAAYVALRGRGAIAAGVVVAGSIIAIALAHAVVWRIAARDIARDNDRLQELSALRADLDHAQSEGALRGALSARNHGLLEGQIARLVELEHAATDPDSLAELFEIDHVATRMRRNAETLIVLAGEEVPRRWSRPVPVAEVVRAAAAETGDYKRMSMVIDESLALAGEAVVDVAHLLAELLDNALVASPIDRRVQVRSHLEGSRGGACAVVIEDSGVGMPPHALAVANATLAMPDDSPDLDAGVGLLVAGRLAARHGIDVTLAPTPGGGVTATVRLPSGLLPSEEPFAVLASTRAEPTLRLSDSGAMAGPGMAAAPLRAVPVAAVVGASATDVARLQTVVTVQERDEIEVIDALPSSLPTLRRRSPGVSLGLTPTGSQATTRERLRAASRSAEEVRERLARLQTGQAAGRSVSTDPQ